MSFPVYRQHDAMDCGPSCLRMIARHYGRHVSLSSLRDQCFATRDGVSLLSLSEAAERLGMRTLAAKLPFRALAKEAPLPCIVHWRGNHFVVVHKVARDTVYVADPAQGLVRYPREEFLEGWINGAARRGEQAGITLLLEPAPAFRAVVGDTVRAAGRWGDLLGYLKPHRKLLGQLALGCFAGSVLQLLFPLLTQAIVDVGVGLHDLTFLEAVLAAQLMLFAGQTTVEMVRGWILLHVGARVGIAIISDFLIKLMKLPLPFFETRTVGDILQRIGDHERIKHLLTSASLQVVFSFFNLAVFGAVLALYDLAILALFLGLSGLSVAWLAAFLRWRRDLDHRTFGLHSRQQDQLVELVTGMQEIKLQGLERTKRWAWERLQAHAFRLGVKGLSLAQWQQGGAAFLHQLKNILITFLAARAALKGDLTLGMMMSVQYIVGQLNAPMEQLIGFLHTAQDAKLSLERIQQVQAEPEERDYTEAKGTIFPGSRSLRLRRVSFQYGGPHSPRVLEGVDLELPEGKITAIVGASGSGKTTLLKLLLGFYPPTEGDIRIGDAPLAAFDSRAWRARCGAVMQDGHLFSDTIQRNIACGDEPIDSVRLRHALAVARLEEFIAGLPLGDQTKIGEDGQNLSGGQRQRILIARAVYRNPEFLFFDEATSSLDANHERAITEGLNEFLRGRTAVIIAHRLSTVRQADQIVVLDRGRVAERGTHAELVARRGAYFDLIRNQLELGD